MKKFIEGLIALLIVATVGITLGSAASIPQPFSTRPYVYDSVFPAAQLNTDFQYALNYTDTAISGPMPGNAATATSAISADTATSAVFATNATNAASAVFATSASFATSATSAVNASVLYPAWSVVTASGVTTNGEYVAANTTSAPLTLTLPASAVAARVSILDAGNTFGTNNLTILSASGVNLNSTSGSPASAVVATSGVMVDCYYLNTAIGYRCITQ